jgi:hypothetical protein
LLAYV